MPPFISIPIVVDAAQAAQDFDEQMAAAFPGWTPAAGNLEVWIRDWAAQMRTDLAGVAADVPAEIFYQFGAKLLELPPIAAAAATAATTWTAVDDAGYTIPAGTLVAIPISGDEVVAFAVAADVVIAAGDTATATGEVILSATVEGEAGNGLTSTPSLIDALAFVDSIVLESATAGGADAEDPNAYLDRLRAELRLLAPRPILPPDAATLARSIPGVARAVAINGYNPGDDTYGNEKYLAVAGHDVAGAALPGPVKTAIQDLLEAQREVNFVCNAIDPTFTQIKVSVQVACFAGFDPASVAAAVSAAIAGYLAPASWGTGPSDSTAWRNVTVVRQTELVTLVNNIAGVDYIVGNLQLAKTGDPLATTDVNLAGPAPLTQPGTITVTT